MEEVHCEAQDADCVALGARSQRHRIDHEAPRPGFFFLPFLSISSIYASTDDVADNLK